MPPADPDLAILVLAAGKGSRMGGPKILMDVRGKPWCQWQRERLDRVGHPTLWVVPPGVRDAESASSALADLHTIPGNPAAPMFVSFLDGLSGLSPHYRFDRDGGLFVLPIDTPAPAPDVWLRLAANHPVAIPTHRGSRGHPVFLSWRWIARLFTPEVRSSSAAHRWRLDELIRPDAVPVEVDDPDIAVNLNTSDDVAAWLARQSAPPRAP